MSSLIASTTVMPLSAHHRSSVVIGICVVFSGVMQASSGTDSASATIGGYNDEQAGSRVACRVTTPSDGPSATGT